MQNQKTMSKFRKFKALVRTFFRGTTTAVPDKEQHVSDFNPVEQFSGPYSNQIKLMLPVEQFSDASLNQPKLILPIEQYSDASPNQSELMLDTVFEIPKAEPFDAGTGTDALTQWKLVRNQIRTTKLSKSKRLQVFKSGNFIEV